MQLDRGLKPHFVRQNSKVALLLTTTRVGRLRCTCPPLCLVSSRNTNSSIFSLPPLLEDYLYHLVPLPVILLVHHHLNDHHCPNNIHIYCRQHDHIHHLQHSVQPLCPHLASPFQLALLSKWPPNQDTHCLSHPPPCIPYFSPPSSHRPTPARLPLAMWLYLSICITM